MARALMHDHHGQVPADMAALVKLPGVGRKTANVVLGHALGVPGFPVDRHVLRVSNRLGLVTTDDAEKAEAKLCAALPPEKWTVSSDTLILHGRRICRPKPMCDRCAARPFPADANERLHRLRLAFEHRLHGSVGAVRDPAGDAARVRRALDRPAEAHALDVAVDDDVTADQRAVSRPAVARRAGRGTVPQQLSAC